METFSTGIIVHLYLWLIVVTTVQSDCNNNYQSYVELFVTKKSEIIGASYLQSLLNQEAFKSSISSIDVTEVDSRLTSLKGNLATVFSGLQDLRIISEMLINDTSVNAIQQCCKVYPNTTAYDIYYQTRIADTLCYRTVNESVSPSVSASHIQQATQSMKKIKEVSNLIKWMYVGLENGIFIKYPAAQTLSCSSYDPRVRPWYVEAASRNAKNVIILIDISQYLGIDGLSITKQAAVNVLATLGPRDKVAIVTFSQYPIIQLDCGLAYATPNVTTTLTSYINSLTITQYGSDFSVGLQAVAKLFVSSPSKSNTIIFLTRGHTGTSYDLAVNLVTDITKQNVSVLVYGVLPDPHYEPFLNRLAAAGRGTTNFIRLDSTSNIRFLMGTYYRSLNPRDVSTADTPTVSVPYIDFAGLGNIFTVCLPIFSSTSNFLGAACIDITILDISLLLTFPNYDTSYGFLVDARDGRSIYHPLLPPPGPTGNSQANPLFVNIRDLEEDCEEIMLMLQTNGSDGSINKVNCSSKMFIITLGRTTADGVTTLKTISTFYWQMVTGGLIAGLMVAQNDFLQKYPTNTDPTNFTFHSVQTQQCYHMGSASTGVSSVAFSPDAFISPYSQVFKLKRNHTDQAILDNINQYFQISGSPTSNQPNLANDFQPDIRTLVVLTNLMQSHWNLQLVLHPLRHFLVGFSQGVLRTFPGVFVKQQPFPNFIQDTWFSRAVAQPSKVIFTGPQQRLGNQIEPVITISKATPHGSNDAVVGMEVTIGYLITELNKVLPNGVSCTNCLLLDEAGFVIFHPSFLQIAPTKPIHIGDMEPEIAAIVLKICNFQSCQDFAWKKSYLTWKCSRNSTCLEQGIQASHIDDSNLVLVVSTFPLQGHLTYPYWDIHQCQATGVPNTPCYSNISYNFCQNTFSSAGTGILCNDNTEPLVYSDMVLSTVPQLPHTCMRTVCQQLPTVNDCNLYTNYGCYWCNGQCNTTQCPGNSEGVNPAAIVVPVIFGTFLILIIVILTILYWKGKLCCCPPVKYQEEDLYCDAPFHSDDYLHLPPGKHSNADQLKFSMSSQVSNSVSYSANSETISGGQLSTSPQRALPQTSSEYSADSPSTTSSAVLNDVNHVQYTTIMTDLQAREAQGLPYESSSDPSSTERHEYLKPIPSVGFSAPEATPSLAPYSNTNPPLSDEKIIESYYLTTLTAPTCKPPSNMDH